LQTRHTTDRGDVDIFSLGTAEVIHL